MTTIPLVIAHRGASFDANENSASSITLARAFGADAIEIDVHRTRDGVIVVHHDEDLSRAAGDSRRLRDISFAELRAVRQVFPRDGATRVAEPILTLDEAIEHAAPLPLVVEIKAGDPDLEGFARAVTARLAAQPDRSHRVISFESPVVAAAEQSFDSARVGLIRNTEYGAEGWRDLLAAPGGLAVLSRRIVTAERVAALISTRKTVYVYALDDAESVRAFAALGVHGIISNRPDVARAALRS
jgi:glycerophosphoryl diester phosphodiesterase